MKKIAVTAGKHYKFATHINEMLVPRETTEVLEAFLVIIEPQQFTHAHKHIENEQLYYVISGNGRAIYRNPDGKKEEFTMQPGDVIHVPRNTEHQIFCQGETALNYLCVDGFVGGIPAEEPTWNDHYAAVIAQQQGNN